MVRLDILLLLPRLHLPVVDAHGQTAAGNVHRFVSVSVFAVFFLRTLYTVHHLHMLTMIHNNRLLWGAVLACHAAVSTFAGIMVVRFFLGATEAAVSPGFSLITGIWYTRQEQPLRHGFWFAGNSVATAFGGLVAYGVAQIDGSLPAWKVS